MTAGELRVAKSGWEVPSGFKCRKPMFAEYLNVNAQYDRRRRMGQAYWALSGVALSNTPCPGTTREASSMYERTHLPSCSIL